MGVGGQGEACSCHLGPYLNTESSRARTGPINASSQSPAGPGIQSVLNKCLWKDVMEKESLV